MTPSQQTSSLISSDLIEARRILTIEANAIQSLAQHLGTDFIQTIELLTHLRGRVILSGIGKSGHIANKIASTLSSTGTPSFFLHPSEASHGDLGMITRDDILIILSNSGETLELLDTLTYIKRFSIPLIAITTNINSSLAKAATITLTLPEYIEACPMGLAPTTSTTLMLALGDAIALTLLGKKRFSESDFRHLHPGGKLGKKLLLVSNIMRLTNELPLVQPGTLMSDALVIMTQKGFGCIGIIDHNHKLMGIITDGDLRRHMNPLLLSQNVEEIMTYNPFTIEQNKFASEALAFMNEKAITDLFVIDHKTKALTGLLRMHDCIHEGII